MMRSTNQKKEEFENFSETLLSIVDLLSEAKGFVATEVIKESVSWVEELLRETMEKKEVALAEFPATYEAVKKMFVNIPDGLKQFLENNRDKIEKWVLDNFIGTILSNADEEQWPDSEGDAADELVQGMAKLLSCGLDVVYEQVSETCQLEQAIAKDLAGATDSKKARLYRLIGRYGTFIDEVSDQFDDSVVADALWSVIDRLM